MKKIPQLTDDIIYIPCTPAKWTTKPKITPITEIHLTSGIGMGSKSWYEYVEQTETIEPNTIQEFTRITGKKIKINTSFITHAEDFELVEVEFNNQNPNVYKLGRNKVQYLKGETAGVVLSSRYGTTKTI